jgi:hypothetical protein
VVKARTITPMVVLLRIAHGIIAATLIASIGVIYYSAITHTHDMWLYLAMGALFIEGLAIVLNKGHCPFGSLSRRHGDTKTFFELFLPKGIAEQMFRVNAAIVGVGCVLLICSLFL